MTQTIRTTAFNEDSKPKPKRRRKATQTPGRAVRDVTPEAVKKRNLTEEPKRQGRPPKEDGVNDLVIHLKEGIVKAMLLKRTGKLSGTIAMRVVNQLTREIRILEKRA